ncbi:hypothetical protein JW978_02195 [Candidatus Dojkabacteria bacterium]|nr:hypothetical protein [Candidatus Dojkabacteria bacterium]
MPKEKQDLFKKLFETTTEYIEKYEYFHISEDGFAELFGENLLKVIKIAFDLNLDIEELKKFTEEHGTNPDMLELGAFIVKTIDNDSTYVLLNYYLLRFISASNDIVKELHQNDIEMIMQGHGIGEEDIQQVIDDYNDLIKMHKNLPLHS